MKTLKSTNGTFGLIDISSAGRANVATSDGYTDADNIKTTSIYAVSGKSDAASYLANLPVATVGFLITLTSSSGNVQIFICLGMNMTSANVVSMRRYTSSGWSAWCALPEMSEIEA